MLYFFNDAECSEIYTKHLNTLCGQNVEFVNVKPGRTYSNHLAFKGSSLLHGRPDKSSLVATPAMIPHWTFVPFKASIIQN
jgi:hypothetical protein